MIVGPTKEINGKFHRTIMLLPSHTDDKDNAYDMMIDGGIKEDDFIALLISSDATDKAINVGDQAGNFITYGNLEKVTYFTLMYPRYLANATVNNTDANPDLITVIWTPTAQ